MVIVCQGTVCLYVYWLFCNRDTGVKCHGQKNKSVCWIHVAFCIQTSIMNIQCLASTLHVWFKRVQYTGSRRRHCTKKVITEGADGSTQAWRLELPSGHDTSIGKAGYMTHFTLANYFNTCFDIRRRPSCVCNRLLRDWEVYWWTR